MSQSKNGQVVDLPVCPKVTTPVDTSGIAQHWIKKLETVLGSNDFSHLSELFHPESWWRDAIALQWDLRTIQNLDRIIEFVEQYQPNVKLSAFRLQDDGKYQPTFDTPVNGLNWIFSMFFFETRLGRGTGVFRLTQDDAGVWKAFTLYTSLQELKGFEEPLGPRRVRETTPVPGAPKSSTWNERRQRQLQFLDEEPTALVVGAGSYSILQFLYLRGDSSAHAHH